MRALLLEDIARREAESISQEEGTPQNQLRWHLILDFSHQNCDK